MENLHKKKKKISNHGPASLKHEHCYSGSGNHVKEILRRRNTFMAHEEKKYSFKSFSEFQGTYVCKKKGKTNNSKMAASQLITLKGNENVGT